MGRGADERWADLAELLGVSHRAELVRLDGICLPTVNDVFYDAAAEPCQELRLVARVPKTAHWH